MMLFLIVACRVVTNPFSNAFQKMLTRRHADPLFVVFVTHGLLSVACLPFLFARPKDPAAFWLNMGIAGVLVAAGSALLVQAVKVTDLSVLGPVNAYKSILSVIPGIVLLGEVPGAMGLAGMLLIVAGSYFVVDKSVDAAERNAFVRFFADVGVRYRFAAMALSAVEAVFLKKAMLASGGTAHTLAAWAVAGLAASAVAVPAVMGDRVRRECRGAKASVPVYLSLVLTTGLMQLCTIIVLGGFKVGYALALFQTSALVSVFLGYRVFKERNILERLTGCLVMMGGAVLIVAGR